MAKKEALECEKRSATIDNLHKWKAYKTNIVVAKNKLV